MNKIFFTILLLSLPIITYSQDTTSSADSSAYKTETIEVNALRGVEGVTPIALENVERSEVDNKYWMQDLPMFLNGKTSINSYSESGASIGYSYLSVRGFDQRRISILINGTPQNDPEDHQVYWVDLSDITSSVEDIQIQRGVGTALYGSSSIGGVISVQTINFFKRKFLNVEGGYGDYNSKRYSLEFSSGTVPGGLGVYGKFTKTRTDGYRDLSWSDHWSYFLSAGKLLGNKSVLKLNFYGGPIKNHLAYLGVTKDYLEGQITGDKRTDRKYNFLNFPNETDNYNQPHYELVFNSQLSKNVYLSNTVNYIRGEGYFVTNFPAYYGLDFDYFRLQPFFVSDTATYNPDYYRRNDDGTYYFEPGRGYEIVRSNLVTKLWVNNDTYGWFPKLEVSHNKGKGTLVIGGEAKFHSSEHYGEVTFGDVLPPGTPPDYVYYFYNGRKHTFSAYVNEVYKVTPKLTGMLGLQYVNHKYFLENNRFNPYNFDVTYNFFNPRAGVNYAINGKARIFANFSIAQNEPRLKDIYDAETPGARPNFGTLDPTAGIYIDPLVKPEKMFDYELGFGYKTNMIDANLNFYRMDFQNEIVSNGQLDNVGQPIAGNAGKSIHQGVELEASVLPFAGKDYSRSLLNGLSLSGNLTLSQNYFTDYIEKLGRDSTGNILYGNDYTDNRILLSPEIIGNVSINYFTDNGIGAYISLQHIGKQYLDNSENERKNPSVKNTPGYTDKIIEPYTVVNAGLSFNLTRLFAPDKALKYINIFQLSLKVNNLFDKLYETWGSVDGTGTPYWIPAAERNFYGEIKIGF